MGQPTPAQLRVAREKIALLQKGVRGSAISLPLAREPDLQPGEWAVYALRDPRFDPEKIRYVGFTTHLIQRYRSHLRVEGSTAKDRWIAELRAERLAPSMEILEKRRGPGAEGREAEKRWIRKFRSGGCQLTNATDALRGKGVPVEKLRECLEVQRQRRENWLARTKEELPP